jgi:hypothetical protein
MDRGPQSRQAFRETNPGVDVYVMMEDDELQ